MKIKMQEEERQDMKVSEWRCKMDKERREIVEIGEDLR